MKKHAATWALFLALTSAAQADDDLASIFAACTGRYSAELEHAWLVNSPDADAIASDRARLLSLLDATMTPEAARSALRYRIEAKMAQAALLTTATFGTTPKQNAAARQLADRHIGACQRLILGA